MQLPLGFSVVGGFSTAANSLTADDPALLASYVAEPGHFLASWSVAQASNVSALLKVFVLAPAAMHCSPALYRITRARRLSISVTPSAGVFVRASTALVVVRMMSLTWP